MSRILTALAISVVLSAIAAAQEKSNRTWKELRTLKRELNGLLARVERLERIDLERGDQGEGGVRYEHLQVRFSDCDSPKAACETIVSKGNKALRDGHLTASGSSTRWRTISTIESNVLRDTLSSIPVGRFSVILKDNDGLHIVRVIERTN